MKSRNVPILFGIILVLNHILLSSARNSTIVALPNGSIVPCKDSGNCHESGFCQGLGHANCDGSGAVNNFGLDFSRNSGNNWDTPFCMADTDGDGFSNGMELGDPCCIFTQAAKNVGRTNDLSHPGVNSWIPATAYTSCNVAANAKAPATVTITPSTTTATLSWSAPDPTVGCNCGYNVVVTDTTTNNTTTFDFSKNAATTQIIKGLSANSQYSVVIVPKNLGSGVTETSSAHVFNTTSFSIPSSPQSLNVTTGGTDSLFQWEPPFEIGGTPMVNYTLELKTSYTTREEYTNSGDTSITVELSRARIYKARVRGQNSLGWGPWSDTIEFTTPVASATVSSLSIFVLSVAALFLFLNSEF